MNSQTRTAYHAFCASLARVHNGPSGAEQFTIEPSIEQRLQDAIVEQSTFLPQINVITVDEMKGQNILGSASGPVSGRTDTSGTAERTPRNVLGLASYSYELHQTNSDVYLRYPTMDAWARFGDLGQRYTRYVQERIANDREIIGWHGTSAADTTDLTTNTLMEDVNKGWLQFMRENKAANILTEGGTSGKIILGDGGDYANLDLAANDLLQGIPTYLRKDLVVLVGSELIANEKALLLAAVKDTPTEKNAMNTAMAVIAGMPWQTPSNFPARGLVITPLKNLSIYVQGGTWRRNLKDKPEKDRVEDYNSRNEGYVVETPEAFVGWEFGNVEFVSEETTES